METNLQIVGIITIGFTLASIFGFICQKLRFPSIIGYLLAGYLIGPYSPGFVADLKLSEQLAEIGVILMLFGVGMHFKIQDLISVKQIAIPGAIVQTVMAITCSTYLVHSVLGFSIETGVILGIAIGVSSTVVLVRVLTDNNLVQTPAGHIAIGWTIVEDIITVVALLLLPMLASYTNNIHTQTSNLIFSLLVMLVKFALLAFIMFTWGHRIADYLLRSVSRLRSHELFTLSVLALVFVIATGSSLLFGTSIALGAFIAGIVIGQTDTSHQASANALPLREVFAVIFFLSVGMLFNPKAIYEHFSLFIAILGIILLMKPLAAYLTVIFFRYPKKIALIISLAITQIGEFSFIFAEEALRYNLMDESNYHILVACGFVSIIINPLLFNLTSLLSKSTFEKRSHRPFRYRLLKQVPKKLRRLFASRIYETPPVVIVGYGPVGEAVTRVIEDYKIQPIIIEQNIDIIPLIKETNRKVIYGDATMPSILDAVHIHKAKLLIITVHETKIALEIIKSAYLINPDIKILSRISYISEEPLMKEWNVDFVCGERESAHAFTRAVKKMALNL